MTTHRSVFHCGILSLAVLLGARTSASQPTTASQPATQPVQSVQPAVQPAAVQTPRDSGPGIMVVDLSPGQGKLAEVLKTQVAKAKALHRTPFVELGATWCENCHLLDASMKERQVIDAFAGTYIIRLDIDQWGRTQLIASALSADAGVPAIYAIDHDGKGTGPDITIALTGDWSADNIAPQFKKYFDAHRWP